MASQRPEPASEVIAICGLIALLAAPRPSCSSLITPQSRRAGRWRISPDRPRPVCAIITATEFGAGWSHERSSSAAEHPPSHSVVFLFGGRALPDSGSQGFRQVTSGPWAVRRILHVDETERVVCFTASGLVESDPYRRTVCRVGLDGTGFARLTDDDLDRPGSDRFIDAVVAYGSPDEIAARLDEHLQAGADHVAIQVLGGGDELLSTLEELARPLGLAQS